MVHSWITELQHCNWRKLGWVLSINTNFTSSGTVPKECAMNKIYNVGSVRGSSVIKNFDRTFFYKPTFDFPKSTFVIIHSILSLYVIFGWVIKPANHWFSFLLIETKCRRCFDKRNMGTFAFNTALLALYNVIMLMC